MTPPATASQKTAGIQPGTRASPRPSHALHNDHWASTVNKKLDAILKHAARADGYTYVDTYAASAGHDPCQPLGTRWTEPLIGPADGVSLHPNGLGHEHVAPRVEQAMHAAGIP